MILAGDRFDERGLAGLVQANRERQLGAGRSGSCRLIRARCPDRGDGRAHERSERLVEIGAATNAGIRQ